MNGVAKQYWSEMFDLRAPVDDGGDRGRRSKSRKKAVRRTVRRSDRGQAA